MVIQVYWIKNTMMVREAIFTREVNNAISRTIYNIELIDRSQVFEINKNDLHSSNFGLFSHRDSLNLYLLNNFTSFGYNTNISTVGETQNTGKSSMLDSFFKQAKKRQRPIESRVSRLMIDSLLKIEFHAEGLHTKYEFGVYSPSRNKLILEKTGQYSLNILESQFRYLLFPSDIFSPQNMLMVYFPNEKSYLISKIWIILAVSVFLILTIIFSFIYVISTVFKQRKISEIKNDFINNMTHEFKTPISTISLACQALGDSDIAKNPAVYESYLSIIEEENERLSGMAERILQSARLQKGEIVLKNESIHLNDIIMDAIKKVSLQIKKKGGKITLDNQAAISIIEADRVHITNIIFNLLDNAIKYTPWAPIIKISMRNISQGILINIKDNGVGIHKSDQKKVFEKLYRVPTGNVHNVKGFGLGLSYVKSVIEKHKGKITLESELKKGSTFSVYLPFKDT